MVGCGGWVRDPKSIHTQRVYKYAHKTPNAYPNTHTKHPTTINTKHTQKPHARTYLPIPVATCRAKEARGSGCASFSSRVKPLTSALGRSAPGRSPCLAGSPPFWLYVLFVLVGGVGGWEGVVSRSSMRLSTSLCNTTSLKKTYP